MDITAFSKSVTVAPRKVRLVADTMRKQKAEEALQKLYFIKNRGATVLSKTLKSAIANAVNNGNLKKENLIIKSIDIMDGTALKRYHPSTRGSVHPYKKRTSHIRITLEDKTVEIKSLPIKKLEEEKV